MPISLSPYYQKELEAYKKCVGEGFYRDAWRHLERAHIIGQRYPLEHNAVHWKMLKFGIKIKDSKEVLGQIPRLIFGGIKSFVGKVPVGNPGGANVPPLKPFPIENDLRQIFNEAGI